MLLDGVHLHQDPAPLAATGAELLSSTTLAMIITQGRCHQVKRMIAAAGNRCTQLHRSSIGGLTLSPLELAEGDHRVLDEKQLIRLESLDG